MQKLGWAASNFVSPLILFLVPIRQYNASPVTKNDAPTQLQLHDVFCIILFGYKNCQSLTSCAHCSSGKNMSLLLYLFIYVIFTMYHPHQFDRLSSTMWITNAMVTLSLACSISAFTTSHAEWSSGFSSTQGRVAIFRTGAVLLIGICFITYAYFSSYDLFMCGQIGWPCDSIHLKEDFLFYKWILVHYWVVYCDFSSSEPKLIWPIYLFWCVRSCMRSL